MDVNQSVNPHQCTSSFHMLLLLLLVVRLLPTLLDGCGVRSGLPSCQGFDAPLLWFNKWFAWIDVYKYYLEQLFCSAFQPVDMVYTEDLMSDTTHEDTYHLTNLIGKEILASVNLGAPPTCLWNQSICSYND